MPAYTFPATANVVRLAGATPVLVDVDPDTFNLDLERVYEAVTPRTKAVLAVHLFGRPLDWEALQDAVSPEVVLLEDAAGALGARWQGMPCGGLGAMGCLSFHPRKIVTTGEGGAVTTNDAELAASIRRLRHHGLDPGVRTSPSPPRTTGSRTSSARSGSRSSAGSTSCSRSGRGSRPGTRSGSRGVVELPGADEGDTHGWQAYVVRLDRRDEALAGAARGGDRGRRSAPTRCTASRRTAIRGRSPAPTRPSSGRSRCRSTRG